MTYEVLQHSGVENGHWWVVIGKTQYRIDAERYYFGKGGMSREHWMRNEVQRIALFHERRYVKPPYKMPLLRPST